MKLMLLNGRPPPLRELEKSMTYSSYLVITDGADTPTIGCRAFRGESTGTVTSFSVAYLAHADGLAVG